MGSWSGGSAPRSAVPGADDELRNELVGAIRHAAANDPRTLQVRVGPSELGGPCDRRLAMRMCGVKQVNRVADPWPSTVGTAIHAWLQGAMESENTRLGFRRWITEHRVWADPMLGGTSDLFDTTSGTVVDWKTVGETRFRELKSSALAPDGYMIQANIYGMGWENAGFRVKHVALAMLPRAGNVRDMIFFRSPYDRAIGQRAVNRLYSVGAGVRQLREQAGREDVWDLIPGVEDHCGWCPFFRRGAASVSGEGCPGV